MMTITSLYPIDDNDKWILDAEGNFCGVQSRKGNSPNNLARNSPSGLGPIGSDQPTRYSPYILAQFAVPLIFAPGDGTNGFKLSNATGGFTIAGTGQPFPANWVYSGGGLKCWITLGAAVDGGNIPAGTYFAILTSTTAGTLYNNLLGSDLNAIPASPLAFAGLTVNAVLTQPTTITAMATLATLPGGAMGRAGTLRITANMLAPATANSRTLTFKLSTGVLRQLSSTTSTNQSTHDQFWAMNAADQAVQRLGPPNPGGVGGFTAYNTGPAQLAVDTSVSQAITLFSTQAVQTDWTILEQLCAEILPGA